MFERTLNINIRIDPHSCISSLMEQTSRPSVNLCQLWVLFKSTQSSRIQWPYPPQRAPEESPNVAHCRSIPMSTIITTPQINSKYPTLNMATANAFSALLPRISHTWVSSNVLPHFGESLNAWPLAACLTDDLASTHCSYKHQFLCSPVHVYAVQSVDNETGSGGWTVRRRSQINRRINRCQPLTLSSTFLRLDELFMIGFDELGCQRLACVPMQRSEMYRDSRTHAPQCVVTYNRYRSRLQVGCTIIKSNNCHSHYGKHADHLNKTAYRDKVNNLDSINSFWTRTRR